MMMEGWMVLELLHAKNEASALHSDHRWHPGNPHMAYRKYIDVKKEYGPCGPQGPWTQIC